MAQAPVVECRYSFTGGDLLMRGFYALNYPADDLDRVELRFATLFTNTYTIQLTVREGTYDGPVVGIDTIDVDLVAPPVPPGAGEGADIPLGGIPTVLGTFEFDSAPVTPGSTLTFALEQLNPQGSAFYDVGPCAGDGPACGDLCTGDVIQTEGTVPPLDTFRRDSVGVRIFAGEGASVPAAGIVGAGLLALLLMITMPWVLRRF